MSNEDKRYLLGCAGKIQHKNYIAAEFVLNQDRANDTNSEIYLCPFCEFYHIGTLWENKQGKKPKEKSRFQTKRQRVEMTRNKKGCRRKGDKR